MGPGKGEPDVVALAELLLYLFVLNQGAVAREEEATAGTGGKVGDDPIKRGGRGRGRFGVPLFSFELRSRLFGGTSFIAWSVVFFYHTALDSSLLRNCVKW